MERERLMGFKSYRRFILDRSNDKAEITSIWKTLEIRENGIGISNANAHGERVNLLPFAPPSSQLMGERIGSF